MKLKIRSLLKWVAGLALAPFVLFLLLALLVYIPPVQQFAVDTACRELSKSTGMDFRIERVRLAFPLDLALHGVTALEKGDTLLAANSLRLNVQLLPLFSGLAEVDGAELRGVVIDSKSFIADTHIKGSAGLLAASVHPADLNLQRVCINDVKLHHADFDIALSDTAQPDTTKSQVAWTVLVQKASLRDAKLRLSLPGDSLRLSASLGQTALYGGMFDLGKGVYSLQKLRARDSRLTYDLKTAVPVAKGLDVNHIGIEDLSLALDTVYFQQKDGTLRVGLRQLAFKEKSNLAVTRLRGGLAMNASHVTLSDFLLRTPHSMLAASADMDFQALSPRGGGHLQAKMEGYVGRKDLSLLGTNFFDVSLLKGLPEKALTLQLEAEGNIDHLRLPQCRLAVPGMLRAEAKGYAREATSPKPAGHFSLDLRGERLAAVRGVLKQMGMTGFTLPDGISLGGTVDFRGARYEAQLRGTCRKGAVSAKGMVDLDREAYSLTAKANAFPLELFLPDLGLSPFSGSLRASGRRFDPTSPGASLAADARVDAFRYAGYDLNGTLAEASLRGGRVAGKLAAGGELFEVDCTLDGLISRRGYELALRANVPAVHLHAMGLTKDTLTISTQAALDVKANAALTDLVLAGSLRNNCFSTPRMSQMAKDLEFDFQTDRDTTTASVAAGDLVVRLGSREGLPRLSEELGRFAGALMDQLDRRELDQEGLKALLPVMELYFDAGQDNPLYNMARLKGYSFSSAFIDLHTDPRSGMSGEARMGALQLGGLLLDSIETRILQDSTGVQLYGLVKNNKRNPTPMEVGMKAYVLRSGAGLEMRYLDSEGEKGVELGVEATVGDGGINLRLYPEHPVLAYRNFTVNKDNFIFLGKDKRIRADLDLLADDGTGLKIYGEPRDSMNDLTVSVNQLNLGELSAVMPYLPRLSGMLSGDVHVTSDPEKQELSAMASLLADGFTYEGVNLGDLGVEMLYLPKKGGEHHASAFVSTGDLEVLALEGTYFDRDGGFFEGEANLHDFPLSLLNGFMVGTDVALKGVAGGNLAVKGSTDRPVLNGTLDLDSAHIYSDVYGFDFRTDERALVIEDSRLRFENYNLYSTGREPLVLDGVFDMSNFDRMAMDFTMKAKNFELINTRKKVQSMIYGKVYANYNGTLKGTVDNLSIRGKLEVLDRTDMTYILKDSPLSVDDRLNNLVTFVDFADTTQTEIVTPVPEMGFDLTLGISISDAARFHCNLSDDGQSYVDLEGGGDLTLRMTEQGEMRVTGRFTTNSGEMKYALPVIPLKTFKLVQGSYVEFTGDVMNPTLSIEAKERTKAVVTENDKQRSVAFDVGVALSKPLNEMGLEFTIEAPEDLSIQNELAAMSAEQRGKAAVTLMATGMYMTDETMMSGSGFKANNALNAFLQNEIQNIAGSALKTIDINLGVESGTSEAGTATTDYSFQFAKRFWGNRVSVIVGGKVSTGADATNSAESFINNVSVEYRLDRSATRYVKVFYDRATQDPLEGQLTKTGAGLLLRRKTNKLGELFLFK